jgi:hypothetical protein
MYSVRSWLIALGIMLALTMAPQDSRAKAMPDAIALDSMVQLFEKVNFNHAKHIGLVKDCAECHHHTTGTLVEDPNCVRCHKNSGATAVVACRGCHSAQPFSARTVNENTAKTLYHNDKPGLKGAYHQSCLGCHAKSGGPTGCEDCHRRNRTGDALYDAGEFTPRKSAAGGGHGH